MKMRIRLIIFIGLCLSSLCTYAQENVSRQIFNQAESEYNVGRIDQAIELLQDNMADFEGNLKQSAFRLLALCYLSEDRNEEAEFYAEQLVRMNNYYNSTDDYGFTKPYSDKTAEKIDADVKSMVEEQYERAKEVLRNNMEGLTQLAETLLEKEVIFSDDLERIFGKRKGENKALDAINEAKEQEKAEAEKQTADAETAPSTSSGSDEETENKDNENSES